MADLSFYTKGLVQKQGDKMCDTLKKLQNKTARELLIASGQLDQIPVDIDAVLDTFEVKKIASDFSQLEIELSKSPGDILGLVLLDEEDIGLFYKGSDSLHRKKFTISHELGHCCLDSEMLKDGYIEYRSVMDNGTPKERAANIFAGELLIPEHSLNNVINRLVKPSLKYLAEIFDVSISVMRGRLEVLKKTYYDDELDRMITPE